MSLLLSPLTLRGTTFRNRVWVSPMCQYSSIDGMPDDWHLVHLGARATGGAGLVMTEATAVTPPGRISPSDAGIWTDGQAEAWRRIARFVRAQGAVPGMQLSHAGRKASSTVPWVGRAAVDVAHGGWETVAPSPIAYADRPVPRELAPDGIAAIVRAFAEAARRADGAGFEVVELHAAHGYLMHEFLSPLSNRRSDRYGGDFDGRIRALVETVDAVRAVWPERKALFVRISATDGADGGWDLPQSVALARVLAVRGVDLVDVSSGGLVPHQQIDARPGYQVPFAQAVRSGSGLPVSAVGLITEPRQAEDVLTSGAADAIMIGRASLRDPLWPLRAAHALGDPVPWPAPYERARF